MVLLTAAVCAVCSACGSPPGASVVSVGAEPSAAVVPRVLATTPPAALLKSLLLAAPEVPADYRQIEDADDSGPHPTDLAHPIANDCDRKMQLFGEEGGIHLTLDRQFSGADHMRGLGQQLSAYDTAAHAREAFESLQAFVDDCARFGYVDAGDRYVVQTKEATDQPSRPDAYAFDIEQSMPDAHETPAPPVMRQHVVVDVIGTVVCTLTASADLAATVTSLVAAARSKLASAS